MINFFIGAKQRLFKPKRPSYRTIKEKDGALYVDGIAITTNQAYILKVVDNHIGWYEADVLMHATIWKVMLVFAAATLSLNIIDLPMVEDYRAAITLASTFFAGYAFYSHTLFQLRENGRQSFEALWQDCIITFMGGEKLGVKNETAFYNTVIATLFEVEKGQANQYFRHSKPKQSKNDPPPPDAPPSRPLPPPSS